MQVLTNLDFSNTGSITNLPNATAAQSPVTLAQLTSAVEGMKHKENVRVASSGTNVSVASPGATIDGVTMVVNDRVLLKDQTSALENGIYVWNGAAVAMTRAADANASSELSEAVVTVTSGTNGSTTFRQSTVLPVIGTDAIAFVTFGTVAPPATTSTAGITALATQAEVDAGTVANKPVTPATLAAYANRARKTSAVIGDGAAVTYTVTHNFNTRLVDVAVYRTASPYDQVMVDTKLTTVNTVDIAFAAAPAAGAFTVVVIA
jgi:hypothetical protein